jgi:hypothetical protein
VGRSSASGHENTHEAGQGRMGVLRRFLGKSISQERFSLLVKNVLGTLIPNYNVTFLFSPTYQATREKKKRYYYIESMS